MLELKVHATTPGILIYYYYHYYYLHLFVVLGWEGYACRLENVEVRRQLVEVGYLLPPLCILGFNSIIRLCVKLFTHWAILPAPRLQ